MKEASPVYSHNPNEQNPFPLLVLDVHRQSCTPYNEGFRVLHWHEEIQFVHVLQGKIHLKVYQEEFDVSAGDCLFLNRSVLHCITEKEDCHYHSFLIPERMLGFFPGSIMAREDVACILHDPVFTHCLLKKEAPAHKEYFRALDHLESTYFSRKALPRREYRICCCLTALWLAFLCILPPRTAAPPSRDYERIRAMISYIREHYKETVTVEALARAAHIGKSECLRCFRRFTGDTPYHYLMEYRLHASTVLLKTSDLTITEIALSTGFASASSYIGYFQKKYGMTPRQYRIV